MTPKISKVAIDIQDLSAGVILDSLLERGGELFRTAKNRRAILVGQAAVADLKKKYSLRIDDGPDGTVILKD